MSFLAEWKQAKRKFEEGSGRKKPAETSLGIFRKPSGLEDAFKAVDAALLKKDPSEAARASEAFVSKKASYLKFVESNWSQDANFHLQGLRNQLTGMERAVKHAVKDLDTDPKAKVTLAEAMGEKAVAAFQRSPLTYKDPLKAWIYNTEAAGVLIEAKILRVPGCIQAWNAVKDQYDRLMKLHGLLTKTLPKRLEREKALRIARSYQAAAVEVLNANTGIEGQLDAWVLAAKAAYEKLQQAGKVPNALSAITRWKQDSSAFQQVSQHTYWWGAERQANDALGVELAKRP